MSRSGRPIRRVSASIWTAPESTGGRRGGTDPRTDERSRAGTRPADRMRRWIYLALPNGGVVSLYRLTRTPSGLFVVGTMAKAGAGQHLSYQEDGVCFDHSGGQWVRGRRFPLTGHRGTVTIVLTNLMLYQLDAGDITSLFQV